jgi:hypothetical protein
VPNSGTRKLLQYKPSYPFPFTILLSIAICRRWRGCAPYRQAYSPVHLGVGRDGAICERGDPGAEGEVRRVLSGALLASEIQVETVRGARRVISSRSAQSVQRATRDLVERSPARWRVAIAQREILASSLEGFGR